MSKTLKSLLQDAGGIFEDSRKVTAGGVFVAIKGETADGYDFIEDAVKNGAGVIIGERERPESLAKSVSYFKVKDARRALGQMASSFYDHPSRSLKVIGVTGTDGKTTTASLIAHILNKSGKKVGLITTVSAKIGDKEYDTGLHVTSLDPVSLQQYLAKMVSAGCEYAVIEVTSHGIDQKRIEGTKFALAVLTNITPEHLDYHKTFVQYKKVKLSFVKSAKKAVFAKKDTNLNILPGKFNNINAQTAVDVAKILGIDEKRAIETLHSFKLPPGRLEEIKNDPGCRIYVDFAHTPNALRAVLTYLKSKTRGRLIAVFGCAGERDRRKRSIMGEIASKLADLSIFTAEDPRSEDVSKILSQMAKGAKKTGGIENRNYWLVPERGEAIALAINMAKEGDTVVICGKGHEKSMCYGDFEHPWKDKNMIENILNGREDIAAVILAAGKGKRMHSQLTKVLHKICGRPMISYSLENLRNAGLNDILVVVGYKKNLVKKEIAGSSRFVVQTKTLGTGDAVKKALPLIEQKVKDILVVNGDDSAFYKPETIKKVIESHEETNAIVTFVSLMIDDPHGLGRIVRDRKSNLLGIVEERDASESQRKIKEVNDGLYVFNRSWLEQNIGKIEKSPVSGEYYVVDLIKIALSQGRKVNVFKLPDSSEWQGVNTPEQLATAEEKMRQRLYEYFPS